LADKLVNRQQRREGTKVENTLTLDFPEIQLELQANRFSEVFLESINQTFSKLGTKIKPLLYSILKTHYKLDQNNLPNRTADFVNAIEQIFGASAALVEVEIMKNIGQEVPLFKYSIKNGDLDLLNYLRALKTYMANL
jgi:hypothetical protein